MGSYSCAVGLNEAPVIQLPCNCRGRHHRTAAAPQPQCMHDAKRVQSAPCLLRCKPINGWEAAALALGRGMAIPQEAAPWRPWVALAFWASSFSGPASAAVPPAEVPRIPDWDRAWSTPDW